MNSGKLTPPMSGHDRELTPEELKARGQEPVSKRELWGFYAYSAASEPYSVVLMSVFLPIILETLASANGFEQDHVTPCNVNVPGYNCDVKVGNLWVNTTSFPLYVTSFAVIIQAFLFVSLGALADHGNWRKIFLLFFNMLGAIAGILMLIIKTPSMFLGAAAIAMLGNISFGATLVFIYAYIPTLTRFHPEVLAAERTGNDKEVQRVSTIVGNRVSGHGMSIGYAAGVALLVISAIIVYFYPDKNYAMHIGGAMTCGWWLICGIVAHRMMPPRSAPPLPAGENYFFYSWKMVFRTVSKVRQLSHTFRFLLAWFLLSDGVGTITSVAVIFAKTKLAMSQVQLIIAAVIVPISAAIGVYFWLFIQRRLNLTTRQMLIILCTCYTVMPIYGLLGFVAPFGLKHQQEVWAMSVVSGLMLGAVQSYARVMFAELLPPGRENEFFSLYEITDKGAAWIGPLASAAISSFAGDLRYAFYLLLVMLLCPIFLFWSVDVDKAKRDARALDGGSEMVNLAS